ncbi:MAG: penicillin acylase family protein [Spirochaetota bacterium]|nr:penicillin acylase family protein [Spirochaetota bacterium]
MIYTIFLFILIQILIFIQKPIPKFDGSTIVQGLSAKVTIIRDSYGVPHIYAKNNNDAYYALGYTMAQDRLWQMDLLRRISTGRLSEIFPKNEKIITIDRIFKTFCFNYFSEKLYKSMIKDKDNHDVIIALKHYVAGINNYIGQNNDKLPVEFKLLNYKPEPFTILDSLNIRNYMAVGFNPTLKAEILLGELIKKVGFDRAMELYPDYLLKDELTAKSYRKKVSLLNFKKSLINKDFSPFILFDSIGGSNGWVISSQKSSTGKVVIANDPHILYHNPSIWYEAHIKTDKLNFYGFFLPLIPFGLIGHNNDIGWGITMILLDESDFYIEKIKKIDSDFFYFYKGKWIKIKDLVNQKLIIKGNQPINIEIPITHHGPIISSLFEGINEPISIRWTLYDKDNLSFKTFYLLNHAKNWNEFTHALRFYKAPGINLIYGDKNGNIGYYAAGTIPIRAHKNDGLIPMDGTSGNYEWKGFVPFEQQPHSYNPNDGYIVSANNKMVDSKYPYYISRYWEPHHRIDRIIELIKSKKRLSIKDHKHIHLDTFSNEAKELTPYLIKAFGKVNSKSTIIKKALHIIETWDFKQDTNSIASAIYNTWYYILLKSVLSNKLSNTDYETYLETRFPDKLIESLFSSPNSYWFDDPNTPKIKETRDDIIIKSFTETINTLTLQLGKDISLWEWGKIHQITFIHPFGLVKPLNYLFNIGPFPIGGSRQSINKAHYFYNNEKVKKVIVGPSMRMIIDFSNLSKSLVINTTGQSGHFNHKNYRDQTKMWLKGEYRTAWYSDSDVKDHAKAILTLIPAK